MKIRSTIHFEHSNAVVLGTIQMLFTEWKHTEKRDTETEKKYLQLTFVEIW